LEPTVVLVSHLHYDLFSDCLSHILYFGTIFGTIFPFNHADSQELSPITQQRLQLDTHNKFLQLCDAYTHGPRELEYINHSPVPISSFLPWRWRIWDSTAPTRRLKKCPSSIGNLLNFAHGLLFPWNWILFWKSRIKFCFRS